MTAATDETVGGAGGVEPASPPPALNTDPQRPKRDEDLFRAAHQLYKRTGPGRVRDAIDFSAAAEAAAAAASEVGGRRRHLRQSTDGEDEFKGEDSSVVDPRVVVVDVGSGLGFGGATKKGGAEGGSCSGAYRGPVLGLASHPGFLFCPGALSPALQIELGRRALGRYCERPVGRTNIELVPPKPHEIADDDRDDEGKGWGTTSMWETWKEQNGFHLPQQLDGGNSGVGTDAALRDAPATSNGKPQKKHNPSGKKRKRPYRRLDKLSWSTLGYHYDWTARAYRESQKSDMPPELQEIGEMFAALCDNLQSSTEQNEMEDAVGEENKTRSCRDGKRTENVVSGEEGDGGLYHYCASQPKARRPAFRAQAAIVNYYTPKSVMGGHRDDLELDFTRPVISLSLGLSAVFLLGGKTRDDASVPVVPVLVRSGDVMIMGGESRLCYHGVARVLNEAEDVGGDGPRAKPLPPSSCALEESAVGNMAVEKEMIGSLSTPREVTREEAAADQHGQEQDLAATCAYLSDHRINVNLRQVLPDCMERIPS